MSDSGAGKFSSIYLNISSQSVFMLPSPKFSSHIFPLFVILECILGDFFNTILQFAR